MAELRSAATTVQAAASLSTSLASYRTVVNVETAPFGTVPPHRMQRAVSDDRPACPGATYCNISYDAEAGEGCYLVRFAPGTGSTPHEHIGYEEFLVLDGTLTDSDGTVYRRNDFVSLKPGSKHVSVSADGATLAVFIRGGFRALGEHEDVHR